jgi:FAD/FMN-containing dehydrogenase
VDQNLTQMASGPQAVAGTAIAAFADQAGEHICYLTPDENIHQLYGAQGSWVDQNMTAPCSGGVTWTNYPVTETATPYRICTPRSVAGIVATVREAEAANRRVHAFGSTWSFSDCAMTPDYMIDTSGLRGAIQTVQKALLPGQSQLVYHAAAGNSIEGLYTALAALGLALETQGGSSGQTIAGAISTGTHGGDLFMPPLADSVLALHLIGAGGTEYWIEPSPGITDPALLQQYVVPGINPQNIIYDNATFNACLVSLGCMGVIYAVVLRVRQAYDLVETTMQTTWQDFLQTAPTQLRDQTNRFLQVAVSPYPDASGTNICMVTTRSEAPATRPAKRPQGDVIGALAQTIAAMSVTDLGGVLPVLESIIGNLTLSKEQMIVGIVQAVLSQAPDERPVLTEHYGSVMAAYLPPGTFQGLSYSVMDTTYGQSAQTSEPSYSAEFFFPSIDANGQMPFVAFVNAVIAAISAKTDTVYTGYVSLRFTGATRATLGMQQWPQTCAVELSSLQGVQNEQALYPQFLSLATQHGALAHWGQINEPFNGNGAMYTGYANWRAVYATMSKNFTARTFENPLSVRWGLTTPEINAQLWHNEQAAPQVSASWTNWHYLSNQGNQAKAVQLAAHPDGRMHAVMAGLDNQIWHNEQTAAGVSAPWTDWHVLSNPGNKALLLALAAHPDGRMHAVMAG